MIGDPSFIVPGPARLLTCTRCGAAVAEETAPMERHIAWHREPAALVDLAGPGAPGGFSTVPPPG